MAMSYILACTPDLLSELVLDAGWTEVSKSPALSLYYAVSQREVFLSELVTKAEKFLETGIAPPPLSPALGEDEIEQLVAEYEFVLEVLDRLDIHNTIDHTQSEHRSPPRDVLDKTMLGDRYWTWSVQHFIEKYPQYGNGNGHWKTAWNDYAAKRKKRDIWADYCSDKKPALRDEAWKFVFEMSYSSRASTYRQKLNYECREAQKNGWFLVFDTCTLSPDSIDAFVDNPSALRDYTRSIGRMVRKAELGDAWASATAKERVDISGCYKYFCVPEYGTKNGRLHFHILHMMKCLPVGSVDPNSTPISRGGRSIRKRRELGSMKGRWLYGFNLPLACRYSGDAFTKLGWLWPTNDDGVPVANKPVVAISRYITKYITKNLELAKLDKLADNQPDSIHSKGAKLWSQQMNLRGLPDTAFRTRMSRGFGTLRASMSSLSTKAVRQLTRLPQKVASFSSLVKRSARRELRSRLGAQSIAAVMGAKVAPLNLLASLRNMMQASEASSLASFTLVVRPSLELVDISEEALSWLKANDLEWVDPTLNVFGSAK